MALSTPPSQKYRRIGFHLSGGDEPDQQFYLTIRPQDLTYPQPSRLAVQQTMGGAWLDSFARGIASIRLNGHCGWRGSFLLSGEDAFAALQAICFDGWHDRRQSMIDDGQDPADVELVLTDDLDDLDLLVAPRSFMLRRSQSQPLLMNYSIDLISLGDAASQRGILDEIAAALNNPLRWLAGVTGLGGVIGDLQAAYSDVASFYGAATTFVQGFICTGLNILQQVQSFAQAGQGLFIGPAAALLDTGLQFSAAAGNAFAALTPSPGLPPDELIRPLRLASLFTDAYCTMANSFTSDGEIAIYDAMLGASTCSSTGGGSPPSSFSLAGTNPFESLVPAGPALVSVSSGAASAMLALQVDPLTLGTQQGSIVAAMRNISAGLALT